jgi:hypothetical protein
LRVLFSSARRQQAFLGYMRIMIIPKMIGFGQEGKIRN